jgi:hypothetical protein
MTGANTMMRLEDLGTPADLREIADRFAGRIAAADLAGCGPFLEWVEQILVDHPEKKALLLPPGALIEGDLVLDGDAPPFDAGFGCIVASDDLKVTGRILNANGEEGPSLLVGGSLEAGELIKAASGIVVIGSVVVGGLIVCDGDNGALLVGGNLSARALIDCDHEILVAGEVNATVASDDLGNMRSLLVAEVFEDPDDATNEWPEGDLIRDRLLAGLPVLKPGV